MTWTLTEKKSIYKTDHAGNELPHTGKNIYETIFTFERELGEYIEHIICSVSLEKEFTMKVYLNNAFHEKFTSSQETAHCNSNYKDYFFSKFKEGITQSKFYRLQQEHPKVIDPNLSPLLQLKMSITWQGKLASNLEDSGKKLHSFIELLFQIDNSMLYEFLSLLYNNCLKELAYLILEKERSVETPENKIILKLQTEMEALRQELKSVQKELKQVQQQVNPQMKWGLSSANSNNNNSEEMLTDDATSPRFQHISFS